MHGEPVYQENHRLEDQPILRLGQDTGNGHGKNVLAITYFLPPLGGVPVQRSLRLIRYLQEYGWRPVVVTARDGWDVVSGNDIGLLKKLPPATPILRVPDPMGRLYQGLVKHLRKTGVLNLERLGKLFWYPDDKLLWGAAALKQIRRFLEDRPKPDLIYASGFPWTSFLLGARLKRIYGIPFVADFRDAWSLNPSPFWSKNKLHGWLESRVINRADRLIFATGGVHEDYKRLYPHHVAKMSTIYNGYDPEDFASRGNGFREKSQTGDVCRMIYAGSLADAIPPKERSQSLIPILDGLATLRDKRRDLFEKVRLSIYSNDIPRTREYARKLDLTAAVRFYSRILHAEIVTKLCEADCLLLIVFRGRAAQQFAPAKIYEYIASEKPILALAPAASDAAKIIRSYDLGEVVEYQSVQDKLTQALVNLTTRDYRKGIILAKEAFDGKKLVGSFASAFDKMVIDARK